MRLSWRELARELMDWCDYRSDDQKKLDAIERQHISDDARLTAVVEAFLLGEGHYQPSWRMLIHRLHKAGETHIAEKIKTNAKPQQGERACMKAYHQWMYVGDGVEVCMHPC